MKKLFILLPILALFCCCEGGDDFRYPSVLTDYACLVTDTEGVPHELVLDNGVSYSVSLVDEQSRKYRPDTTYRVISIYEPDDENGVAQVYSVSSVFSPIPTPLRRGETLRQDPVYLQSCWLSGGYLNMVIEVKALNVQHDVDFIDTTPKGMHGREFTFYHDACGDIESYRQKLPASIPLAPFELQKDDTVRLVINLYDKGITRWEFVL